jgi:hypothetical protein
VDDGSSSARWVRPLLWIVRISAAAVIGVAAVVWFRNDPRTGAVPVHAGGLQAELSLPLGGERLLSVYLGPITVPGASMPAHAPAVRGEVSAAAPPVPEVRVAPSPTASLSPTPVSATQRTPARAADRSEFCMVGNGVVSRRSFAIGEAETVSAYGPADGIAGNHPQVDTSPGFALPLLQQVKAEGKLTGMQLRSVATSATRTVALPNILSAADESDYPMGVALGAIDLLVVGRGDFVSELNPWYHTLNAGMRVQIVGPVPCNQIIGAEPVSSSEGGTKSSVAAMHRMLNQNAMYVSDGHSQLLEFAVNGHHPDVTAGNEVRLAKAGIGTVTASIWAHLPNDPTTGVEGMGWNIERARRGTSRFVVIEVIVNGKAVASQQILADGSIQRIKMDIQMQRSGWVALRLMGGGHSNPIYVLVNNQPVRGSRSSVEWSLQALIRAYQAGSVGWNPSVAPLAASAYDYALAVYDRILRETEEP